MEGFMYKLTYRNKFDREEKVLTGTTKEKCIEKYRREVAMLPQNYEIVSIVNDEDITEEKSYNDTVKEKAEKVIYFINNLLCFFLHCIIIRFLFCYMFIIYNR